MKEEPWLKQYWRPLMAYQYLLVCLFDFVLAPILTMILSKYLGGYHPWEPLTLKESGYYHMAMGAILGVAAWTRGQEKIKRLDIENGNSVEVVKTETSQTPTKMD
jgi:hypothetical protein